MTLPVPGGPRKWSSLRSRSRAGRAPDPVFVDEGWNEESKPGGARFDCRELSHSSAILRTVLTQGRTSRTECHHLERAGFAPLD